MPAATDTLFTPPSSYSPQKTLSRLDLRLDSHSDDSLDADIFNMAGTGSPTPYIKEELDDSQFNNNRFMSHGFDMNQPFGNQQFSSAHESSGAINPSELSNLNMNGQFTGSSYVPGGAGIADDELADSLGNFDQQGGFDNFHQDNFFHRNTATHISGNHANINQMYSHTPDEVPIQSPFVHPNGFDFNQYQTTPQQRMGGFSSMQNGAMRPPVPASMARHNSDSRSPMSPKTPVITGLHLGTPDSGNFASQPIMTNMTNMQRHKPSVSGQWDGTPGSAHSWGMESPTQSATLPHQQISEVIRSGERASMPNTTRVDMGQTQDAKKRRRRESHNLVERRRRDNINERIHDLSRLVPQHRLEDEKIRKHINNNGPLSPTINASGMSPPQATSLLAGGTGRRAAGTITQGLPLEEKDKGPNKGDILNGAVSWTRDLMWLLYKKLQENDDMAARLQQLTGEEWPNDTTEEERRMRTELVDAIEKNNFGTFKYSRAPGSGLRVPKHTNLAGEPIHQISPQSLSPDMQSTGSGSNTNSSNAQPQYWSNQSLKEEDEYHGMDMG